KILSLFAVLAWGQLAAAAPDSDRQPQPSTTEGKAEQVSSSVSTPVVTNSSDSRAANVAFASRNQPESESQQDEILHMLREADAVFAATAVTLPDTPTLLDGPQQQFVSLEEVLARTLQNSYSYAASAARAEGAVYAKHAALGQLGRSIDLRGPRGREYSSPASFIDQNPGRAVVSDTHIRWDTSVILRQPLFSPASYFEYRRNASLADAADLRRED